jgi:Tfp pilus assembly protein PilZ
MTSFSESRKSKRFAHKATVMLEDVSGQFFSYGLMLNYSSGGMGIGTDETFKIGSPIKVRFSEPLYKAAPNTYTGTVRWCNELARNDIEYTYGIGMKFD